MATEADFRHSVLPFTLHHEGGLSLDRRDTGNWTGGKVGLGRLVGTKYGIAASAHPMLDIRGLTLDGAGRDLLARLRGAAWVRRPAAAAAARRLRQRG